MGPGGEDWDSRGPNHRQTPGCSGSRRRMSPLCTDQKELEGLRPRVDRSHDRGYPRVLDTGTSGSYRHRSRKERDVVNGEPVNGSPGG